MLKEPVRQPVVCSVLLMGFLYGCAQVASPDPPTAAEFRQQVAQKIAFNFTASEAEVYLTHLGQLSDEEIFQYGDRICESFRRGSSVKEMVDILHLTFPPSDELTTRLQIFAVAERELCPESSFPRAGWQRSLFFLWERFNGGTPL